jgi:hypothetical protein
VNNVFKIQIEHLSSRIPLCNDESEDEEKIQEQQKELMNMNMAETDLGELDRAYSKATTDFQQEQWDNPLYTIYNENAVTITKISDIPNYMHLVTKIKKDKGNEDDSEEEKDNLALDVLMKIIHIPSKEDQ